MNTLVHIMAYIGVAAACAAAILLGPWLDAYDQGKQHGYAAGYQQGRADAPDLTAQCLAHWFNDDPVFADKKLKAACAARK